MEIYYVDAERVFALQAAATAITQPPPPGLTGSNPSKIWPEVDQKQVQFIVNDFKNRQLKEGMQFFDTAAFTRLAPYAVQLHMQSCQFDAYAVRKVAGKTVWRVFVCFPLHPFRVNERRCTTPIEQATFNVARQLGRELISICASMTQARRSIKEMTSFLALPENTRLPMDL